MRGREPGAGGAGGGGRRRAVGRAAAREEAGHHHEPVLHAGAPALHGDGAVRRVQGQLPPRGARHRHGPLQRGGRRQPRGGVAPEGGRPLGQPGRGGLLAEVEAVGPPEPRGGQGRDALRVQEHGEGRVVRRREVHRRGRSATADPRRGRGHRGHRHVPEPRRLPPRRHPSPAGHPRRSGGGGSARGRRPRPVPLPGPSGLGGLRGLPQHWVPPGRSPGARPHAAPGGSRARGAGAGRARGCAAGPRPRPCGGAPRRTARALKPGPPHGLGSWGLGSCRSRNSGKNSSRQVGARGSASPRNGVLTELDPVLGRRGRPVWGNHGCPSGATPRCRRLPTVNSVGCASEGVLDSSSAEPLRSGVKRKSGVAGANGGLLGGGGR